MHNNVTFDLLIKYRNGEEHVVEDVSEYGLAYDHRDIFYYKKNNNRGFIPVDAVLFIGKDFDYMNGGKEK